MLIQLKAKLQNLDTITPARYLALRHGGFHSEEENQSIQDLLGRCSKPGLSL